MRWLLLALCILSSCRQNSREFPSCPQRIRTCLNADISSLDPRKGANMITQSVLRMLHAGLVYLDENLEPKLDLASSYQVFDNYRTYVFFLKDCVWSDGSPITAYDFERSWKEALSPTYCSFNTNLLYFIKNAKAAFLGEVSLDKVGIHAIDNKTLVIELEKPNINFLNILINIVFSPVHKSMKDNPNTTLPLISSGPFQMQKYSFQNQIILEKSPTYWDANNVKLEEIQYFIIKDPFTAQLMFEKGEIDWLGSPMSKICIDSIPALKKQGFSNNKDCAGTQWIFINTKKTHLSNSHIRKALAYAINRSTIMKDILHQDNISSLSLGLIPKILKKERWHPWFQDHDIKQACYHFSQGLKELNLTPQTFPIINLLLVEGGHNKVAEAITQMWSDVLGIRVKCETVDSALLFPRLVSGDFDATRLGWVMQYNDMGSLLEIFKTKNVTPNFTGWENSDYIYHTDSYQTANLSDRLAHIEAAEQIFFDEMPSIPVYNEGIPYLCKPYVKGVHVNYLLQIDFRRAYIDTN